MKTLLLSTSIFFIVSGLAIAAENQVEVSSDCNANLSDTREGSKVTFQVAKKITASVRYGKSSGGIYQGAGCVLIFKPSVNKELIYNPPLKIVAKRMPADPSEIRFLDFAVENSKNIEKIRCIGLDKNFSSYKGSDIIPVCPTITTEVDQVSNHPAKTLPRGNVQNSNDASADAGNSKSNINAN